MPAKKTQLRVDPADGNAYSLDSFLECYGEDEGQRRWGSAGQQPAGVSLLHDLVAFVCLSTIFLSACSSCARPLSDRLSWALLSPCSPRPRIVCRSLAFVLSVSCNTRCLKDIDQTLLSRLLCGDFRTSSCAYSS